MLGYWRWPWKPFPSYNMVDSFALLFLISSSFLIRYSSFWFFVFFSVYRFQVSHFLWMCIGLCLQWIHPWITYEVIVFHNMFRKSGLRNASENFSPFSFFFLVIFYVLSSFVSCAKWWSDMLVIVFHTHLTFSPSTIYQKNTEFKKQILCAFLLPHQFTPSLTFGVESRDKPRNLRREIQRSDEKLEKKEKQETDDTSSNLGFLIFGSRKYPRLCNS